MPGAWYYTDSNTIAWQSKDGAYSGASEQKASYKGYLYPDYAGEWIKFYFNKNYVISKIRITSQVDDGGAIPYLLTIFGSNTDSNWFPILSRVALTRNNFVPGYIKSSDSKSSDATVVLDTLYSFKNYAIQIHSTYGGSYFQTSYQFFS